MNPEDVITLIVDRIVELDELSGGFMPDDPKRKPLDDAREALSNARRSLAQKQFDENTGAYKDATERLAAVNAELKTTIKDIGQLQQTIANLNKFLAAVNTVANAAIGVLA